MWNVSVPPLIPICSERSHQLHLRRSRNRTNVDSKKAAAAKLGNESSCELWLLAEIRSHFSVNQMKRPSAFKTTRTNKRAKAMNVTKQRILENLPPHTLRCYGFLLLLRSLLSFNSRDLIFFQVVAFQCKMCRHTKE